MKHEKLTDKQSTWARVEDGEYIAPSFFDTPEFKAYCVRVGNIVAKSKHGVCIAAIHRGLGNAIKREWTCDALDWLSDAIAPVNAISPIRYKIKSPTVWQEFTRGNVHLFGRSRKHDKTYPIL